MYHSDNFGMIFSSSLFNCMLRFITKTYLYNFDTLKPHFYIVKLGFTGAYIIFLIFAQNIHCKYSLEPPRSGGFNEYPWAIFVILFLKNIRIFIWKLSVFCRWNVQFIWIGVFFSWISWSASASLCSLIWAFSVRRHILQSPLIL